MSKVDALRAMREAKYARTQQNASRRPAVPPAQENAAAPAEKAAPARSAGRTAKPPQVEDPSTPPEERSQDVCGHRSMNGRTCTREAGHEQKNHRYS